MARSLARIPGIRRLPTALTRSRADVAFFESWHGRYSDSPRALSEELRRRRPDIRQVWSARPGERTPDGVVTVSPGEWRYLREIGRSRWLFNSNEMPGYFRKRPSTSYVQTWHGTPLKRIAFDMPPPTSDDGRRYLRNLAKEVQRWDYLISPNRFSTDVLRQAFRYDGEVLETGYPRNDALRAADSALVRERVRRHLGIEEGRTAVLYAPTWRDSSRFELEVDLPAFVRELGDTHVLLLRLHQLVDPRAAGRELEGVLDVSSYQDIRELYLAADVLVTDYSSVMFDFAVTQKPMAFFTYDLDRYREVLRGFYFDFEREAPGPLVTTTDGVVEALRDPAALGRGHAAAYARFRERFCHLDDGHASARVLDAVVGPARPRRR